MEQERRKFTRNGRFYNAGRLLIQLSERKKTSICFSSLIAVLAGAIELTAHTTLLRHSISRFVADFGDATAVALFVFLLTYVELAITRERRLRVLHDVKTVSELNHHVRNALQAIQYAAYTSRDLENVGIITGAVERIDHILRELYPVLDGSDDRGGSQDNKRHLRTT